MVTESARKRNEAASLRRGSRAGTFRVCAGLLFWLIAAVVLFRLGAAPRGAKSVAGELFDYYTRRGIEFELRLQRPAVLEVGDGVYLAAGGLGLAADARPVGEISALLDLEGRPLPYETALVRRARIRIFDRENPVVRRGARARLVVVPESSGTWVFRTLFTPEKAALARAEWERAFARHRDRLLELLQPVAEGVVADCEAVLEEEAEKFFERHKSRIARILEKAEAGVGEDEAAQLFEREVWPLARKHLEPVFDDIGREIRSKLPVWSLAWRFVYEKLPFTADDHFERRWREFVQAEVIPILRARAPEIVRAAKQTARDSLSNPRVYALLRSTAAKILEDPEVHELGFDFLREVFLRNPRLHERLRRRLHAPETRRALAFLSEKVEETVRRIGDLVLGTREGGITPEFARVLRAQILEKDARRVLLEPGPPEARPLEPRAVLEARVEPEVRR